SQRVAQSRPRSRRGVLPGQGSLSGAVVFAKDLFGRRTVVEEVIDARGLDAVAAGRGEIEAPGAGATVEFAVAGGGDQERDGGGDGFPGKVELRIGTRPQAVEALPCRRLAFPGHSLPGRFRFGEI